MIERFIVVSAVSFIVVTTLMIRIVLDGKEIIHLKSMIEKCTVDKKVDE